jgi:uncharacterized protein YndB with AHSA1/START domain
MTANTTDNSVHASIVVQAPVERAFSVFTEDMAGWWPPEHHILQGELAEMVFEPRQGGHVFDRATDGSECHWGRVLAYEPPTRLVIGWYVSLAWQLEPDSARTSEVEVRFIADGPSRTRVELEHRHLERHGDGWEEMRAAVDSPEGWMRGLRRFADRAGATV